MSGEEFRKTQVQIVAETIRPLLKEEDTAEGVAQTIVHKLARKAVQIKRLEQRGAFDGSRPVFSSPQRRGYKQNGVREHAA